MWQECVFCICLFKYLSPVWISSRAAFVETHVRITAWQIQFSCLTQGIWAVLLTSVNQIMCRKLSMCVAVFKIALDLIVSLTWFPDFFQFADPLKIFQWRCGPLGRVFKPLLTFGLLLLDTFPRTLWNGYGPQVVCRLHTENHWLDRKIKTSS